MKSRLTLWAVLLLLWLAVPARLELRVTPQVCTGRCTVALQTFVEDDEIDAVEVTLAVDGAEKGRDQFPARTSVIRRTYTLDEPGEWTFRASGFTHSGDEVATVTARATVQ